MTTTMRRTNRQATPARWQAALQRALAQDVRVLQLVGSGAWLATSGTNTEAAYELQLVNGVVAECACPAGQHGDPCCKHAVRYYHLAGVLDLDPEPGPASPAAPALATCSECWGTNLGWAGTGMEMEQVRVACPACRGASEVEEGDGDEGPASAPLAAVRGLTRAQAVALKADALRHAVRHEAPLVDPFSGRVVDRRNCRDAAQSPSQRARVTTKGARR